MDTKWRCGLEGSTEFGRKESLHLYMQITKRKKSILFISGILCIGLVGFLFFFNKGIKLSYQRAFYRKERTVTFTTMGDTALNYRKMGERYQEYKTKYGKAYADAWPYSAVKPYFKGIVFGNLETPITDIPIEEYPDKDEIFYFRSPGSSEDVLKAAGFHVLSVANNHIKDSGLEGMFDSARRLEAQGIRAPGIGKNIEEALRPVIFETDSEGGKVRTAMFAINTAISRSVFATMERPGTATGTPELMANAIKAIKPNVDVVVVSVHWGDYYSFDFPIMPPDAEMRRLAHAMIDAGASFIIGHHSHAVGEIERYKNGLIVYSLGEFVFAGRHTVHHATSIMAQATLNADGLLHYTIIPCNINPLQVWYRPVVLDKKKGEDYLNRITMPRDDRYQNFYSP